jgi:GT2 family glycosyltransferase
MLIRAELLHRLAGFDDRYYLSWEDVDLSLRVRNEGRKLLVAPGARIYHKGGQSGKNLDGIYGYYAVRNSLLLASKHSGADYPHAAMAIVAGALRHSLRIRSFRLARLRLVWDGVRDHLTGRYGPYEASHGAFRAKGTAQTNGAAAPAPAENRAMKI